MTTDVWTQKAVHLVGGLTEIGFIDGTDLVLVAGHQGRGVFDCATGSRVARDGDEDASHWFDATRRAVLGIGPADGEWIGVFGLSGGEGMTVTDDGWQAVRDGDDVVLTFADRQQRLTAGIEELRAFSFSPNGDFFVLATPGDLTIFARP